MIRKNYERNYDRVVLNVFDTFGSFFIDRYYNFLYQQAANAVNSGEGGSRNITDTYRGKVINYMGGIKDPRYYKQIVMMLQEYYQKESGFSSMILSEFENTILSAFIPPEYYKSFNNAHKEKVMRDIIIKTVDELGSIMVGRDLLPRVIDDHRNTANITYLQDRVLDILITQREEYYSQFIKTVTVDKGMPSKRAVEKLKQAFAEEKKQRIALETDRDRALAITRAVMAKFTIMEREIVELRGQLSELERRPSAQVPVSDIPQRGREPAPQGTQASSHIPSKRIPREKTPHPNKGKPAPVINVHISPSDSSSETSDGPTEEELYQQQRNRLRERMVTPPLPTLPHETEASHTQEDTTEHANETTEEASVADNVWGL